MQPIDSVSSLNSFVALERGGVQDFVHNASRVRPQQLSGRLRCDMLQSGFAMVRQAQAIAGPVISQGFGTGSTTLSSQGAFVHVPNPGINPAYDRTQATLRGGMFGPVVALVCLPWLPVVGIGVSAAAVCMSLSGAGVAFALHYGRARGSSLTWLEDAAGVMTALGRASLTAYAAVLGAALGFVTCLVSTAREFHDTPPS